MGSTWDGRVPSSECVVQSNCRGNWLQAFALWKRQGGFVGQGASFCIVFLQGNRACDRYKR